MTCTLKLDPRCTGEAVYKVGATNSRGRRVRRTACRPCGWTGVLEFGMQGLEPFRETEAPDILAIVKGMVRLQAGAPANHKERDDGLNAKA